jgi:hypothetical protein
MTPWSSIIPHCYSPLDIVVVRRLVRHAELLEMLSVSLRLLLPSCLRRVEGYAALTPQSRIELDWIGSKQGLDKEEQPEVLVGEDTVAWRSFERGRIDFDVVQLHSRMSCMTASSGLPTRDV